ncbi:hypothetical protein AWB71_05256 [Caballeronia peredens]|nr:hypothetical protein AWB71_05256 [Caballeronia peredens]
MKHDDFMNNHRETPYYTAKTVQVPNANSDGMVVQLTFIVRIPSALYTAFGHEGNFEGSALRVRLCPVQDPAATQETFDRLNSLLLKLHKKPNIRAMKLPTLLTTFANACKTNNADLIDEILQLPLAKEFSAFSFGVAAKRCIEGKNYDLYLKMYSHILDAQKTECEPVRELDEIISDLISEACAADQPKVIEHLSALHPSIDIHQGYDRFFYRAVYSGSWNVAMYFFANSLMTLSTDMEDRIKRNLSTKKAEIVIQKLQQMKYLPLQTKLNAELSLNGTKKPRTTKI